MLYKQDRYLNKSIPYLVSNEIIEYDIQSAGFNLSKQYNLLDDKKISFLETLSKKQQQIQIGLYQRKDRVFKEALKEKFIEIRKLFFESNGLRDIDVLSIKKDAIVTFKTCHNVQFGEVTFAEKNVYTSYYNINGLEFYYNNKTLDVKGIGSENEELHRNYMLDFLFNFFRMNEISTKKRVIDLLVSFNHHYKDRALNIEYYRELSPRSYFRMNEKMLGDTVLIKHIGNVKMIDIGYNHENFIVPLISITV